LFYLIAHSDGVICGITQGMHLAAAFDKPCVVLAGGREPDWWVAYRNDNPSLIGHVVPTPHVFLSTQGQMPCCMATGCGKSGIELSDRHGHNRLCVSLKRHSGRLVPECHTRITASMVLQGVDSYTGA
jgi:hypothetical protein